MFKSQIRQSTIDALREKVLRRNYGKYLVKMNLQDVRGIKGQVITFDFPVTAVIGPNGGGKTTVIGAAATAYAAVKPRLFFAKSGRLDESMANWRIEYELIDRAVNRTDSFRRTASFVSSKWSRSAADRDVISLGVSRTVPASERKELQKCATRTFEFKDDVVEKMRDSVVNAVKKILGKDISRYAQIRVDQSGRVSLLTGETDSGTAYSEFHFGAGESSVIRMVMRIEAAGENALVLIEEIENGLHPVATIRLVEYLVEVAERKSIQAIFTTHSNDALMPLPSSAIWASINGSLFQGKLDIGSLRAITGQVEAALAIFCEDLFAAAWIRSMLRATPNVAVDAVEVHQMAGDGTAVAINRHHNANPAVDFPSVCILDGDSRQADDAAGRVFRLPGANPEAHVFDRVLEALDREAGRLIVRLQQPLANEARVIEILRDVRATNRDPHILYAQVAERLGFMPQQVVQEAFFTTWNDAYAAEREAVLAGFLNDIPVVVAAAAA
jgi:predicted ATPase